MFLHYWFLLPVGILIAMLAMSAGVSGAALWVPLYMMWLGLDVAMAFWLGLLTMLFGFGSGTLRNWRDRTYNGRLVLLYSCASVPAAILGALAQPMVAKSVLVTAFGIFLIVYSAVIAGRAMRDSGNGRRRESVAYGRAIIEGVLTGLLSVGTGVLTVPEILRDRSIRFSAEAIGSGVMIIFATSLAATLARLEPRFVAALGRDSRQLAAILIWAAPAAVIGGQIGPRVARRMPSDRHAALYLSAVLMMIGVLTLMRAAAHACVRSAIL